MEISGLSRASVHSYLPYRKGLYKAKELSLDAERSRRYRERKDALTELKDNPHDMDVLWKVIEAFADYPFKTYPKGIKFHYKVKGNEMFISRKKKSVTRATVVLAYQNAQKKGNITRAKDLGTFGASYLYPVFLRIGCIADWRENRNKV